VLLSVENILGFTFLQIEKKKLLHIIEQITEKDCKIIVENIPLVLEELRENLDFVKKILYK
jgi:hypothetical protein